MNDEWVGEHKVKTTERRERRNEKIKKLRSGEVSL